MSGSLKIKVNYYDNLLYLILIPFLYPRGFQEYFSTYKSFFTTWLYIAMVLVAGMFLFRISRQREVYKSCIWVMLLYYTTFIAITLLVQGGISEGLQKLFMAPMLCLLCSMCLQKRAINFIRCVSNILILNFTLNITLFNPLLWENYFAVDRHIIFLGHVQVVAQLGVLGVFLSCILRSSNEKKKANWLLILSILSMIISDTSASYVTIVIICIFLIVFKYLKNICNIIQKPGMVIEVYVVLNAIIFVLLRKFESGPINQVFTLVTSGRTFVWRAALKLMAGHWLLGYGVYGVLIRVFWSEDQLGMNYAHNELMQRLMDGGIVLAVIFLLMIYVYTKNIHKCSNGKLVFWAYAMLDIIFAIMLFESVTEYYYFFVLLSLMAYLPEIEVAIEKRNQNHGNYF